MWRLTSSLAVFTALIVASSSARADLVGYWSFDDGSGTVLTDTSGRSNDGTLSGTSALPTWVTGHTGQTGDYALAFTGSAGDNSSADPHVQLGTTTDLAISGNQTISMWLYPTNFAAGVRQNPYAREFAGSGTITQEDFEGGPLNYYRGSAGGNGWPFYSFGSPALTLNTWNFATVVQDFDAGIVRWYVNGRTKTQQTQMVVAGNTPAYFGRGYVRNYFGRIDSASIWNEALQHAEVIALQNDAYTPLQLASDVYLVDVAGYTYSAAPNAHSDYYRDEGKDGGSPRGDLTDGPYVYVGQDPVPNDGTVGWLASTPVDITFDLGGMHHIDKTMIGYSLWTPGWNGVPNDVQIALSTDGVFDTETFTTYTGFTGEDFRNDLFLDVGAQLASYVMLRFDGGAIGGAKYILDEVAFFAIPEPVSPTVVVLGNSGWQVSWDSSLNPFVDIAVDAVTENAVFIETTAEFIQGKGPAGFPTIPITFTQIKADAVKQIVINDEVITNSTGSDWTGFQFQLLDGNDVAFNPDMTNASAGGNGFSSSPFDNQIFGPDNHAYLVDGLGLSSGGGNAVIADGTQWFPGDGAHDGELYIDVVTGDGSLEDPFTVFTLKETPSFVPEPSTICLLVMGGLILLSSSTRPSSIRR